MRTVTCRIKDYIQPFERYLAIEELQGLTMGKAVPIDGSWEKASLFRVTGSVDVEVLRGDLAYWEAVGIGTPRITAQLRGEATSIIARNGISLDDLPRIVPEILDNKRPNKRCLRYATHGVHEYRGKFFPQLVRALMNMARVPRDGIVLDPMCGSGTTLVEAALSGRCTYGLDMNPLSVFVTNVKCKALSVRPKALIDGFNTLSERLSRPAPERGRTSYLGTLSDADQDYLRRWFAASTLEELDRIARGIGELRPVAVRNHYTLCLSNILRSVSWQKDDDLRVRKEIAVFSNGAVIARFLKETMRSTKTVVAYIAQRGCEDIGRHAVAEADARDAAQVWPSLAGQVDAVITSPPYATALPYLDTDRLSLIYLGLLSRAEHRSRDTLMIGNREVTERVRAAYWEVYESDRDLLPDDTRSLIERIDRLNKAGDVGFRRRNLSALLAKYFFDMRAVLTEQLKLLRPGGVMFMVVGNNRTTAGGEAIEIRTTDHLARIAQSQGFRVAGNLAMDMLVSRDIFRKNAMPSEQILTLQKDQ